MAAMNQGLTRGDVSIHEVGGSPVIHDTRGVVSVTRTYNGMFLDLVKARPKAGDPLNGFDDLGEMAVKETTIAHGNGGKGTMTVKYELAEGVGEKGEGTLGVSFDAVEKPLLTHPRFKGVDEGKIEAWKKAPAALAKDYLYEVEGSHPGALEGKELEAAKMIAGGTESWLLFAPVVKLTQNFARRPGGAGRDNGKRQQPPVEVEGAWAFLRMGDELAKDESGNWTLTRSWQGAHDWNGLLYEEAR
jgi:hypothetical protein